MRFGFRTIGLLTNGAGLFSRAILSDARFLNYLEKASRYYWVAAAPVLALPAPTLEVLEDRTTANSRKITIQVRSLRQAPKLSLSLEGAGVISSKVEGRFFRKQ